MRKTGENLIRLTLSSSSAYHQYGGIQRWFFGLGVYDANLTSTHFVKATCKKIIGGLLPMTRGPIAERVRYKEYSAAKIYLFNENPMLAAHGLDPDHAVVFCSG